MIRGVVLSEKILPEIAIEVTPHGVNVIALVLGLVVLDQEQRGLHPVVVRIARLDAARHAKNKFACDFLN